MVRITDKQINFRPEDLAYLNRTLGLSLDTIAKKTKTRRAQIAILYAGLRWKGRTVTRANLDKSFARRPAVFEAFLPTALRRLAYALTLEAIGDVRRELAEVTKIVHARNERNREEYRLEKKRARFQDMPAAGKLRIANKAIAAVIKG